MSQPAASNSSRQWEHDGSRAPEYGATPRTDTPTEARQGVTGHNVRFVLMVGTGAAVLGMIAVYAIFFA